MLTTKGELAGGAHISLKGNFNFNAAYAMGDHFSFITNASSLKNENSKKDNLHKMIELGAGYFNTFGSDRNRIFELYAGFGRGRNELIKREFGENDMLLSSEIQNSKYDKTFVQLNYSSKKIDKLRLFGVDFGLNYGTALRMSFIKTDEFFKNGIRQVNEDNIFFEPVFFTRMVLSDEIQLQYTSGSNFGVKSRKFLNAGNSIFTVGMVVNLGRNSRHN